MTLLTLAPLAAEIPPDHIAANLALPLGFLFFSGTVFVLLWSVYGAKKGALIYGTAFFAVSALIGVFWWFGAPGTPPAQAIRFFPGQDPGAYTAAWYAMEPGSERAEVFFDGDAPDLEELETPAELVDMADVPFEERQVRPAYSDLIGSVGTAVDRMLDLYLPTTEADTVLIGPERRADLEEAAGDPPEGMERAVPFFTAEAEPHPDDPAIPNARVAREDGMLLVGAPVRVVATFVDADPDPEDPIPPEEVVVEEAMWFAFQDPGMIWFPSAVWTLVSLVLFAACLFGLDAVEQREKRRLAEREPIAS